MLRSETNRILLPRRVARDPFNETSKTERGQTNKFHPLAASCCVQMWSIVEGEKTVRDELSQQGFIGVIGCDFGRRQKSIDFHSILSSPTMKRDESFSSIQLEPVERLLMCLPMNMINIWWGHSICSTFIGCTSSSAVNSTLDTSSAAALNWLKPNRFQWNSPVECFHHRMRCFMVLNFERQVERQRNAIKINEQNESQPMEWSSKVYEVEANRGLSSISFITKINLMKSFLFHSQSCASFTSLSRFPRDIFGLSFGRRLSNLSFK